MPADTPDFEYTNERACGENTASEYTNERACEITTSPRYTNERAYEETAPPSHSDERAYGETTAPSEQFWCLRVPTPPSTRPTTVPALGETPGCTYQ